MLSSGLASLVSAVDHLLCLVCRFNTFHLEASSSCRYDYVAVYDGQNSLAPLLGKFCGAVLPPNLLSSTNHMFLVFRTDASVSGDGWRATYRQTLGRYQLGWWGRGGRSDGQQQLPKQLMRSQRCPSVCPSAVCAHLLLSVCRPRPGLWGLPVRAHGHDFLS